MSNELIRNEIRCLRMHLLPILKRMEELEKELKNPGTVSTNPATIPAKAKGPQQGRRTTKKDLKNQFLQSKGK